MSPTTTDSLIQVENATLVQNQRLILQAIDLVIRPNQIVSIIGPNGAGKTSLIKLMIGLVQPSEGRVVRKRDLKIGYMPQQLHLDPLFPLSCARFLMLGGNWSRAQLEQMLVEVGVSQVLNSPMQTLSGGELQRVLLARALLRQPDLLVLDEPAQGVDLMGQGEFYDLISKMQQKYRCAVLLVSHDLNVVMARTDFVVCLNQHVCCSGHPEKVTRDPAFSALFGSALEGLAFYTHRHDHHHDVHGEVVEEKKDE